MNIVLPQCLYEIIQAAAIEVFPMESFGLLLGDFRGDTAHIHNIFIHQAVYRTRQTIILKDESRNRVLDWFSDRVLGDWHSHPNEPASISRMRDFKDKKTKQMTDEWGMLNEPYSGEGTIALVVSVYPKIKRPLWGFKLKAYCVDGGKIVRMSINIV